MGCGASIDYKKKNIEDKASWNESFTKSVRADLVQMRFNPIEEDFDLNLERELGKGGCGVVVVGEKRDNQEIFAIKLVINSKGKVRACCYSKISIIPTWCVFFPCTIIPLRSTL